MTIETGPPASWASVDEAVMLSNTINGPQVRLIGSRCRSCGQTVFRPSDTCPNCGSGDTERLTLGTTGTVWSYTVCHHWPPGHRRPDLGSCPFVLALVEMADPGLRIVAPLDVAPADVEVGLAVRLRPLQLENDESGCEVFGFTFVQAAL